MAHGFTPDRRVAGIREVTPAYLHGMGARGVITDLDNTLALPDDLRPTADGAAWLQAMRSAGIPVVVVSNNSRARVEAFCRPLGVDFVHKSGKPFGRGIGRAVEKNSACRARPRCSSATSSSRTCSRRLTTASCVS